MARTTTKKKKTKTKATPKPTTEPTATTEADDDEVVVVKRPKNFTEEEDVMLARAFVSASLDPIHGADQKSTTFWCSILSTFNTLLSQESETTVFEQRSAKSLENRYKRHLQHDAQEWIAIYKNNPMKSGENEDDHMEEVSELYRTKHGRPYRFQKCMTYLFKLPKFDPNLKSCDSDDNKSAFSNLSSGHERPIGQKAAKKKIKEERDSTKLKKRRVEAMDNLSQSVGKLATVMELKEKREYLLSMFKTFKEIGDDASAQTYLQKLKSMEKEESQGKQKSQEESQDRQQAQEEIEIGAEEVGVPSDVVVAL